MGFRAQVVTREREYGSSVFSDWDQFDSYFSKLQGIYSERDLTANEARDYFEIERTVIDEEIERLYTLGADKTFEFPSSWSNDYPLTNRDIIEGWKTALSEIPKDSSHVALEWY